MPQSLVPLSPPHGRVVPSKGQAACQADCEPSQLNFGAPGSMPVETGQIQALTPARVCLLSPQLSFPVVGPGKGSLEDRWAQFLGYTGLAGQRKEPWIYALQMALSLWDQAEQPQKELVSILLHHCPADLGLFRGRREWSQVRRVWAGRGLPSLSLTVHLTPLHTGNCEGSPLALTCPPPHSHLTWEVPAPIPMLHIPDPGPKVIQRSW